MKSNFCFFHRKKTYIGAVLVLLAALTATLEARADQTTIAVAANFTAPAQALKAQFETDTDHTVVLAFGSTGKLFAQIVHGAPFDAFLAADQARAERAVNDGLAVAGTRFTYALGRIVLYSPDADLIDGPGVLSTPGAFARLAIANPETAPYGLAAEQTLNALGVLEMVRPKLVRGDSITQAHKFVMTGAAAMGFLATSQVADLATGSRWAVPQAHYAPIRQDAVLLNRGQDNTATKAFLAFLKSPQAHAVIEGFGYGVKEPGA